MRKPSVTSIRLSIAATGVFVSAIISAEEDDNASLCRK